MAASSSKRREPRAAVDDRAEGTSRRSRLDIVSSAILSPFTLRKPDSSKLLSDCTCTSFSVQCYNVWMKLAVSGSGDYDT